MVAASPIQVYMLGLGTGGGDMTSSLIGVRVSALVSLLIHVVPGAHEPPKAAHALLVVQMEPCHRHAHIHSIEDIIGGQYKFRYAFCPW